MQQQGAGVFQPVNTNVRFPALEEEILAWWRENQIVEKSLAAGDQPFVFYEGPPTANGRPGFHHIISRSFKDIILRFRAMQGYRVIGRREGWDTHGLPVEIEVEKQLGFSGKPDIERYGIAAFNAKCRESVWNYIQEWRRFSERIAFWLDPNDAYITYENRYIESLWWVFAQLWQRDLLFRDYKVTMHCPRCGTSLSDHEVSLGFKDGVDDPSVWVRFRHLPAPADPPYAAQHPLAERLADASFVAWTTTPWTLPANAALAVNPDAEYVLVEYAPDADTPTEQLVLAAALVQQVLGEHATVRHRFRGRELVGLRYVPLFQGVGSAGEAVDLRNAYRVLADDFVSLEDGTGIVHIAPAYGDLEIGKRYGLPTLFSVDLNGKTLATYNDLGFGELFFKEADPLIARHLKERGLMLKTGRVSHAYPFCWRCSTPLLYYAKPSWYIRTTAKKQELINHNQAIHWVPEHIRDGRFGNWLENNIDWAVSRERYWGTPLPLWTNEDGSHIECIGSVAELEAKVGRSLQDLDLHRPYVDDVTWNDPQHGLMRRIPDVADCWFDSGAMQVAQWHYPFANQSQFAQAHPADYICEAVDQTRGWFYTLHAIGTLLFDAPAFTNVICLGHILDEHGQKMSKSRGNIIEPWGVFEQYGVDALRWNLFAASPPGNPRRFSLKQVDETLRQFMLTLWNTYGFLVTYANLDGWQPSPELARGTAPLHPAELPLIDRWALASLNKLVQEVTMSLEAYEVTPAARAIEQFVDELSNWYVRRNRRRFWKSEADADKHAAYTTLYTCLVTVTKLIAPFAPFVSEAIYRNLVVAADPAAPESVHLARFPTVQPALLDEQLVMDTAVLLRVVSLGRAARKQANLKVRQPLGEVWVRATPSEMQGLQRFEDDLRDELNVKQVRYVEADTSFVNYRCKPNLRVVGKKYGKQVPAITAALAALDNDTARAVARAVEAGLPFNLPLGATTLELAPTEVLVEATSPDGYAVAESDGALVALNTTITPDLRREGLARELVRNVQDARKTAGLDISDRIALYVAVVGNGDHAAEQTLMQDVVQVWGEYIRNETLATRLELGALPDVAHTESVDLDVATVQIGIVRVS